VSISLPNATELQAFRTRDLQDAKNSYFSHRPLSEMLLDYIRGIGKYDDWIRFKIRQKIDQDALQIGLIGEADSMFDAHGRLKSKFEGIVSRDLCATRYDMVPSNLINSHIVLPESANEHQNVILPPGINMVAKRPTRSAVRIYSATGCELYLHPFCYQVFWRGENWFCPSASNRCLSKPALLNELESAESCCTARSVVVIQDRFPGSNFSHFLFDWVTRFGLICESGLIDVGECLFAFGGAPGKFESMLLEVLAIEYGVSDDQFLFPSKGIILKTTKSTYWFSDQTESYLHPAQMAHARSIGILRKVAARLTPRPWGGSSRVYISRSDAGRRRVANELEIMDELAKHDFDPVVLSDLPVDRQFALLAGADIVVGPHGMGLTQLSLHPGNPSLIELHHPNKGTDAYALMASAMARSYQFVTGEPTTGESDDFVVPLSGILTAIERLDLPATKPVTSRGRGAQVIVDPARELSGATQKVSISEIESGLCPAPPFMPEDVVWRHVRGDPQVTPDSNVGFWNNISLQEERIYTGSCWVWIPRDFRGSSVELHIGEWPGQRRHVADINIREQWQLITAGRTPPVGVHSCNVVLRLTASKGEQIFSSAWALEAGLGPHGILEENRRIRQADTRRQVTVTHDN
jgi:hypothetical protein